MWWKVVEGLGPYSALLTMIARAVELGSRIDMEKSECRKLSGDKEEEAEEM